MQASNLAKTFFLYDLANMTTFAKRINESFDAENMRRRVAGEAKLRKTDLWMAAGVSSGAASHWFDGSNGADLDICMKIAPLLRVDPHWLFDESVPKKHKKEPLERRGSKVSKAAFSLEEEMLLDGFRLADAVTKRHMLRMAEDALADFGKRSGEKSL